MLGPAVQGAGTVVAAILDGCSIGDVGMVAPDASGSYSPLRWGAAAAMAAGAAMTLLGAPWLLGFCVLRRCGSASSALRRPARRTTAGAWSLAANTAALITVCTLLRNTWGLNRATWLVAWLAWTTLLGAAAVQRGRLPALLRALSNRWGPTALAGAGVVVAAALVFHGEWLVQSHNGDGTEAAELARSLSAHFLPHWEVETLGRMGTPIGSPTLVNSYWTCAAQLALGSTEAAARWPFWLWCFALFLAAADLTAPAGRRPGLAAAVLLGAMLFVWMIWYVFYVGYDPYMADLAAPGVPDALFTVALLLMFGCLRRGDLAGVVAWTAIGSAILYAGPVFFALTVGAAWLCRPVSRRRVARCALGGTIAVGALVLFYVVWGWFDGSLGGWAETLQEEYVEEFMAPTTWWRSGALFGGYFVIGCGGLACWGLVRPLLARASDVETASAGDSAARTAENAASARDGGGTGDTAAWQRVVAAVAMSYLTIVLVSGEKNLHYLGPILPLPLVLWLSAERRSLGSAGARRRWQAALIGCLIAAAWSSWPPVRPVFTLNRQLGALTRFDTDDYAEGCAMARLVYPAYEAGVFSWHVGAHTWLGYSRLSPAPTSDRPLLVTRGAAPPGYERLFGDASGVALWCNDPAVIEWLRTREPPAGADRFARLFHPIAPRPPCRASENPPRGAEPTSGSVAARS